MAILSVELERLRTYYELISFLRSFAMDGFDLGSDLAPGRDAAGRFVPGTSGNPAGKKPGTRNRRTVLAEALWDGEDTAVARVVIDKALAGDAVAARFLLGLINPKPRGRAIELDLPETARAGDIVAVFDATLAAMAAGEITPDEALIVTRVLDGRRRALQAAASERRLDTEPAPMPEEAVDATAAEAAPPPAPEGADASAGDRGDTPNDGETGKISLHSPCISPSPATIRGIVANLPTEERRLVAATIRQRYAAETGGAASAG
jgi:hypothetical protein